MIAMYISKMDVSSAKARAMAMGELLSNVTSLEIHTLWFFLLYCMVCNFMDSMLAADITPQHVSIPGLILWKSIEMPNNEASTSTDLSTPSELCICLQSDLLSGFK